MNILHSLSVIVFFFILSSVAEPLKLIPGEHSVIKKDGVTHSISKYYVVPADFDLNANANGTSHKTTLGNVNKRYTKNMNDAANEETDAVTVEHKLDEYRVDLDNKEVNKLLSGETEELAEEKLEENENVNNTSTADRFNVDSEELGNLQVEPINHSISSNVSNDEINVTNPVDRMAEIYATVNTESNSDVSSNELLKDFSVLVYDSVDHNLDSFWGVFNNYVINISDKNKQFIRMEKLFNILNVFSNLYDAIERNIPIDVIIDDLTEVIIKSYIKNTDSNRKEFPHHHHSNHHIKKSKKECIRKCYQQLYKHDLDSKDVSISETDGWVGNNYIELEKHSSKTYLPSSDSNTDNVNVWLKLPVSSPESYLETSDSHPINIQNSDLVNPNYSETERMLLDVSDGYKLLSPTVVAKEHHIARESNVYDDPNLNLNILDTAEMNKLPWTNDNSAAYYMPRTVNPKTDRNLIWSVNNKGGNTIPWTIEDREVNNSPWIIEERLHNKLPAKHNLLLSTGNKIRTIPLNLHPHDGSELMVSGDKVLLGTPQTPLTTTVNGVTLTNHFGKPYLYAYVLRPTKLVYGPKITKNIVKIKPGKYKSNNLEALLKNTYGLSSTYEKGLGSKVMLINNQSPQYYELNNRPGYYESVLNIEKDVDISEQDKEIFIEPEILASQTPQDYYESVLKLKNQETENYSTILRPNELSGSSINQNLEEVAILDDVTVEQLSENSEILLPNVPSNSGLTVDEKYSDVQILTDQEFVDIGRPSSSDPVSNYESQLSFDAEKEKIYTLVDEIDSDAGPVDFVQPFYDSQTNVDLDQETEIISPNFYENSLESEYAKLETDYNLPIPGYNGETVDVNSEVIVSNKQYEHIEPSISTYLYSNQPSEQVKTTVASTYQLFSIENLIRLHNALFKIQQYSELDVYQARALTNLNKINKILLILAQNLGKADGNQRWYEEIFYNVRNGNPIHVYVYNLLRQKWLHEIMLTLYRNNFNLSILSNPRLFSLLGAWRFPYYILKLLETEENNFAKLIEEKLVTPGILDDYQIENLLDDYKTQGNGLVFSITEFNAGLDADVIVNILKHYLLSKQYIENQETIINRGNKIEMFKQIVLFLKEKGYQGRIILDLIRKLYSAVFSVGGKGCIKHYNDYVQTAYDVIVPVLRRSGS